MRSMKNVAVFPEDGAFALFFHPHRGGFDSSRVPTPRNLPSKAKKVQVPGVSPGGRWAQLELTHVLSHQVGFLYLFGLKTGIDFAHFGPELGMVFEGTTLTGLFR